MKQKICLNMIVKNESKVIQRCLDSLKSHIDRWVIVDTGSTDGTQELIKKIMKGIPGELHERPWVNFAHNRTEALQLAKNKGDYLLFIDADELISFSKNFKWPHLDKNIYLAKVHLLNGVYFFRCLMADNQTEWFWKGVLHEQIFSNQVNTIEVFEDPTVLTVPDGKRSTDPQKFLKDIEILEKALSKDPSDTRNTFFLAQSYVGAGLYRQAIQMYERRSQMGEWEEEVYQAIFSIGLSQMILKMAPEVFIETFLRCYRYRPSRAEPLYWVVDVYISKGRFDLAYPIVNRALTIPFPSDGLLVDHKIYDHGLLWQKIVCAFELNKFEESYACSKEILAKQNIPEEIRKVIVQKISEKHPSLLPLAQSYESNFNKGSV